MDEASILEQTRRSNTGLISGCDWRMDLRSDLLTGSNMLIRPHVGKVLQGYEASSMDRSSFYPRNQKLPYTAVGVPGRDRICELSGDCCYKQFHAKKIKALSMSWKENR